MGDDRRPTYLEVGADGVTRRIWRASSLGACDRSLVMHALEYNAAPTPAHIQRAYDAGHAAEVDILRAADVKGWRMLEGEEVWQEHGQVDESGQLCVELRVGVVGGVEQVIRCHPDGIALKYKRWPLKGEDECGVKRVAEAKFLRRGSPYTSVAKARSSRFYSWQTSVEMHGTGLGLLMAVGWKEDTGEVGEDGEEGVKIGSVDVEVFDDPMYTLGQIKARVFRLARMVERAEEEGLGVVECDWAMFPCAFYESHDGQQVWKKKGERDEGDGLEADDEGMRRLRILAEDVDRHMAEEKKHKERKVAAQEKLLVALEEYGAKKGEDGKGQTYVVGDFTVDYKALPAEEAGEKVVQVRAKEERVSVVVKRMKKDEG